MDREIVCVHGKDNKFFYRPMGKKTVTAAVKKELLKYKDAWPYNCARVYCVFIREDENGKMCKPNSAGYYSDEQVLCKAVEEPPIIVIRNGKLHDLYTNQNLDE